MAKCLGRFVEKKVFLGDFVELTLSSKDLTCSHQKIVDDSIVMGETSIRNVGNIKKAPEDYGHAFRKIINWN